MASECDGCDSEQKWILHNTRHRGIFHRLCTSCVLKFNPDSFCCVCYQVFSRSHTIPCSKCPSLAHLHCVSTDDLTPNPYTCPPCFDRSFSLSFHHVDGTLLDAKLAKMLVTASWIASVSMRKAATAKRMDAQCRLKDAAFAKKAAMESLDLLASTILVSQTKGVHNKEENQVEIIRVSDPVNPADPLPLQEMKDKNKKYKKKKKCKTIVSVGGPNPVKLAFANQKKKKKKKSKAIEAAAQSEIYKKLYTGGNSKTRHAKNRSGSGNVTTVSENLPRVVHTDPNNNALLKDGDRWKLQNCVLAGGFNNSQGHILKEEAEKNGSLSSFIDAGLPHSSQGVT